MPWRTRSSRTTAAITATLPPCEFMKMSFLQPVRATLSPISVQARVTVSIEKVSVPGYSICSFDLPIACRGKKRTGKSAGTRSTARAR